MRRIDCDSYKGDSKCNDECAGSANRGSLCCFYCDLKESCGDTCFELADVKEIKEDDKYCYGIVSYSNSRISPEVFNYKEEWGVKEENPIRITLCKEENGKDKHKNPIGYWTINAKMLLDHPMDRENVLLFFRSLYTIVEVLEKWGNSDEIITNKLKEELNSLVGKDTSVGCLAGGKIAPKVFKTRGTCLECGTEVDFSSVCEGYSVEQGRSLYVDTCSICGVPAYRWN